jgi:hypothetical protein
MCSSGPWDVMVALDGLDMECSPNVGPQIMTESRSGCGLISWIDLDAKWLRR